MRTRLLAVAALLACSRPGLAQTVRGAVVAEGDRPVSGVVVILVDGAREVARALTNERGEYTIMAPRPGSYRLRTLRIGFQSVATEPISLAAGADVTRRLAVATAAFALDTVRAIGRNQCKVVAGDSASSIARFWDQVRAALIATQLTYSARTIQSTSLTYQRMVGVRSQRIGQQSMDIRSDFVRHPWRALTPDSLRKVGYVYTLPDSTRVYNLPDIAVLTSDEFIEDHCLRISRESDARRVGIDFEPPGRRGRLTDIRGTLWLDRKTNELVELEFSYIHNVRADEERNAGGLIGFARMNNGMWAISRWSIRMPSPRFALVRAPNLKAAGYEWVMDSVKVTGGELISMVTAGSRRDTLWVRQALALRGVAIDSITGTPIAGAIVSLDGTTQADTTGGDGRFRIEGVLPGRYGVNVATASLDSLGAIDQLSILFADSTTTVTLRVPSAALLGESLSRRTSAFAGRVTDSAGAPLAGADVIISDVGLSALSGANGAFRINNVRPGNHKVLVRRIGYGSMEASLDFVAGTPTSADVVLTRVTALDSMTTLAALDPNMVRFEARRKEGRGHFLTLDSVKAAEARGGRIGSMLERRAEWTVLTAMGKEWAVGKPQPPTACTRNQGPPPKRIRNDPAMTRCLEREAIYYLPEEAMQNRGMPIACFSRVYLDGYIQNPERPTAPFDMQRIQLKDVEAVELYVGASQTPRELMGDGAPCGVIVIHTRRKK
jgi:hypothetical protein